MRTWADMCVFAKMPTLSVAAHKTQSVGVFFDTLGPTSTGRGALKSMEHARDFLWVQLAERNQVTFQDIELIQVKKLCTPFHLRNDLGFVQTLSSECACDAFGQYRAVPCCCHPAVAQLPKLSNAASHTAWDRTPDKLSTAAIRPTTCRRSQAHDRAQWHVVIVVVVTAFVAVGTIACPVAGGRSIAAGTPPAACNALPAVRTVIQDATTTIAARTVDDAAAAAARCGNVAGACAIARTAVPTVGTVTGATTAASRTVADAAVCAVAGGGTISARFMMICRTHTSTIRKTQSKSLALVVHAYAHARSHTQTQMYRLHLR